MKDDFPITSVHRDDLDELGFDALSVDDETMESLAQGMADAYVENCFWPDLKMLAENLGIKRKKS
jgi:hypothetical protein